MHFFILLALAHTPHHVPSAACNVPSATYNVRSAMCHGAPGTSHAASRTWHAARGTRNVDESFQSAALGRAMKYRVLVPQSYEASQQRYPVLYLLHGLDGDHTDWTTRTNLAEYTRTLPLIIVMPDGGNSWYTNAVGVPADRYEDYILTDLQLDVVRKYRTINSRYGRAIAGLSMGGYGALKMALKRPAAFAVAGSFSGAFSITREDGIGARLNATDRERIQGIYGAADGPARRENDVYALAASAKPGATPYLYVDCGTTDVLLEDNRQAIAAISKARLAYEYHEVPGAHSWDYWDRRIREFLPVLMSRMANP
jgi:S-formylglutathione hydrolase FrmB